jgi:hypothetical protein
MPRTIQTYTNDEEDIMKSSKVLSSLMLFVIAIPFARPCPLDLLPSKPLRETLSSQSDCAESIDMLMNDKDWFDQLVNPILTSIKEVSDKLLLYSNIHQCLDGSVDTLPDDLKLIHTLTEYFMVFAGGFQTPSDKTALRLESLDTTDDPAVKKIRDEAGVAPPIGFVYIRYYSSRDAMPAIVRQAFENKEVVGVTLLVRYIAVLIEDTNTWAEQILQNQTVPETISHELIHAYMNSILGVQNLKTFPIWYKEGIAIYLSGSGKDHSAVTPDFTISTTSPEDYHQYDLNFKYLEAKFGRKHLLELIKQSIDELNPLVLYQDLGLRDNSYNWLAACARGWEEKQNSRIRWIAAIVMALLALAGWWVISGIRRLPSTVPEVQLYVIFNDNTSEIDRILYEEPDTTSRVLVIEPIGSAMRVIDTPIQARMSIGRYGQWIWVKDNEGRFGYILAAHVREQ